MKENLFQNLLYIGFVLLAVYIFPWRNMNWGKIETLPASTLTINGEAKRQEASQIARFSAGVSSTNKDKQTAIDEVNQKMTQALNKIKEFGIEDEDIQTQSVSIYETDSQTLPCVRLPCPTAEKGWHVSNRIDIVLREIDRASELLDLLGTLQLTEVSGPRFSLDDTSTAEADLLKSAIDDARTKAETIAQASGRKLGKIITVTEGSTNVPGPLYRTLEASETTTPVEPGAETIYKTVTVVFEIK